MFAINPPNEHLCASKGHSKLGSTYTSEPTETCSQYVAPAWATCCVEAMALDGTGACARLGVPHLEGGIPLPTPSHNGLAIWREAPTAHSPGVAIEHLHLYTCSR